MPVPSRVLLSQHPRLDSVQMRVVRFVPVLGPRPGRKGPCPRRPALRAFAGPIGPTPPVTGIASTANSRAGTVPGTSALNSAFRSVFGLGLIFRHPHRLNFLASSPIRSAYRSASPSASLRGTVDVRRVDGPGGASAGASFRPRPPATVGPIGPTSAFRSVFGLFLIFQVPAPPLCPAMIPDRSG